MPETAAANVEMTCLQGMADLEQLEGPLMDCFGTNDPERTAAAMRLLLTHMTWNSKRLLGAMVRLRAALQEIPRDADAMQPVMIPAVDAVLLSRSVMRGLR